MSAKKRGSGADEIYSTHMFPKNYLPNTAMKREMAISVMLQRVITGIAVSRFKWEGLPKSVDPRFLEMCLFYHGLAVVYKDNEYDKILAVRGAGAGWINMLDNPVSFQVIGPGAKFKGDDAIGMAQFYNKTIPAFMPAIHWDAPQEENEKRAVPVWANDIRMPDTDIAQIYASRLAWTDRTLEINTKNARRTKFLKGDQNTKLSLLNINRAVDQGDEVVLVTGAAQDMSFVEALDMGVGAESFEKLHIFRTRSWNECMGLLGIENANQDKKERLVAAEVSANDGQTDSIRFMNLNARKYAAEQMNRAFDLQVSVEYNTEIEKIAAEKGAELIDNKGDDNVDIHDETE